MSARVAEPACVRARRRGGDGTRDVEMAADRFGAGTCGFRVCCWFFAHDFQVRIWVWFRVGFRVLVSTREYPMDIRNKLFGIKTQVS